MQVILIQDANNLGAINEVVKVKDGYGRNFLIPKKIAIEASESNMKQLDERRKIIAKKEEKMLAEVTKIIEHISNSKITIKTKVGANGKIFGSISTVMIARQFKDILGYQIDRRKITIPEVIKEVGVFEGDVTFSKDKVAKFSFEIEAE